MDKLFLLGFVFAVIFCFTKMVKFLMKITPNETEEDNSKDSSASSRAQETQPPKLKVIKNQNVLEENKPKDKKVYLSTIAKTWLKDNFAYLNEAFNDAEDGIAILAATKLPKDKDSWKYICEILKSADEITDFEISQNIKIKI